MRLALVVLLFGCDCVMPPPQQQPYPPQQQPYPPQQQQQPAVAYASCHQTLECYGRCNPMTEDCLGTCDRATTPESAQQSRAVVQCMATAGCADQSCVAERCGAQITTCTNLVLAATPPAATGGGGPDEVMTPQYYNGGGLIIPEPRRMLTQADLAGEWEEGSGAISGHVANNGYVTYNSVSTASTWKVDADGNLDEAWRGATTGAGGVHGMSQNNKGTLRIDNTNVVTIDRPAQNGNQGYVESYIVTGWFVGPDVIIMKLQGPHRGQITAQDRYDATHGNSIYSKTYTKKR